MTRLLIIIFALNSFMIPISAQDMVVCDMMDGSSMPSSLMVVNDTMPEMKCDLHEGVACTSIQCASSCTVASIISLVSANGVVFFTNIEKDRPQTRSAFFYNIIHPIHTPPPLV